MARTVRWTASAMEDLAEAAEFIAKDSRFYALTLVQEARTAARSLRDFAERGRIVPECDDQAIRELFVKHYRLIYRYTADHVFILAFVHGARDFGRIWRHGPG